MNDERRGVPWAHMGQPAAIIGKKYVCCRMAIGDALDQIRVRPRVGGADASLHGVEGDRRLPLPSPSPIAKVAGVLGPTTANVGRAGVAPSRNEHAGRWASSRRPYRVWTLSGVQDCAS